MGICPSARIKNATSSTTNDQANKSKLDILIGHELAASNENFVLESPKQIRKSEHRSFQTRKKSEAVSKLFVQYESEKIILTGNWEIENGIDETTPVTDISYPPPRVGKLVSDKTNFRTVDCEIVKNNDLKLGEGTFEDVAKHLTKDLQTDILKLRALTMWMSCQQLRTRTYKEHEAKTGTVLGYMKQIKEHTGTFAGLLSHLCRAISIPCVIVRGIYKSAFHNVGEDDLKESYCTWNAVYLDGSWQLVHPFLFATPQCTQTRRQGWILSESSTEENRLHNNFVLNMFFCVPNPSDFIYCCFPEDPHWQLLDQKWSYDKFLMAPFLRSSFFAAGMKLRSEHRCIVESKNGRCHLKIECLKDIVHDFNVTYELCSLEPGITKDKDWGDLVYCIRNENMWHIQIKFPVQGTFKLALFGTLKDWFFFIGDFKIICQSPMPDFTVTPSVPKEVSYGLTQQNVKAGILCLSHDGGIIFYKPNEEHVIKFFKVNEKILLTCELENTKMDKENLRKYCRISYHRDEIDIVVNLPFQGEFALCIYSNGINICNFLFIDADNNQKRENLFQRNARTLLHKATAENDIDVLENCLLKFDIVKLEHDDDYCRGARRVKYLKLKKGLRDSCMRQHEETLYCAIDDAENSPFRVALQKHIDKAKALLESLQGFQMHPELAIDQNTIAEIANFANPPHDVHKTMIATYLLLGEEYSFLQKWGNIQSLLRRHGKDGIKYRIDRFQEGPIPDEGILSKVNYIYNTVPKPYIVSVSLSAATFYNWVSGVLGHVDNTSQNARDSDSFWKVEADQKSVLEVIEDDIVLCDLDNHILENNEQENSELEKTALLQ